MLLFAGGLGIMVVILAGLLGFASRVLPYFAIETGNDIGARQIEPVRYALAVYGLFLLVTVPLAMLARKESRSDIADQVLRSGCHLNGSDNNPVLGIVLTIIMVGMLYGEFLLIDSAKATLLRLKLHGVDRYRAASIISMLLSDPRGIDPTTLLRYGENPLALRKVLAYLIACEWVDISPDGHYLNLMSSAKRALRHA
jgi:hypothetical protein